MGLFFASCGKTVEIVKPDRRKMDANDIAAQTNANQKVESTMKLQYLEIVTPDVNKICDMYAKAHGLTFRDCDPHLGNARTARIPGGGMLGVRAPLSDREAPIVRPYLLVDDLAAAVEAAAAAGAIVALPSMELPGHGKCAIVNLGGIEHGLWQV